MPELYSELKDLIDELEMHQPAVTDAATEGISPGSSGIEVSIWLESYTTIPDAGSDSRRR